MIQGQEIPKYPKQLHIEITTKCNLSCIFCPIHKVRENRGDPLTDEEIISLIHQAKDLEVDYIDFVNYGETLLHPHWFDFVSLANLIMGQGHVGMVTNATIMSQEIAEKFVASKFCLLIFSVDGYTKEVYEKVRVGANRDKIYKNINFYLDFLAKRGISNYWPHVAMTVCKENEEDIDNFLSYWREKRVGYKVYRCTGRGGEKPFTNSNSNSCNVILDGMWVLNDGRVTCCCEDWKGIQTVGNVRESSLRDIWNSPSFLNFRTKQFGIKKCEIALCKGCHTSMDVPEHNVYYR